MATVEDIGMEGWYRLSRDEINKYVTRKSAGNYILGNVRNDTFYPQYVGRADSDVAERLKQHADAEDEDYKYFIFAYATSPKTAFERECKDYHHLGENQKLDNVYHPDRPNGMHWKCPVCA